jgi:Protein of unknown function (DUF1565)
MARNATVCAGGHGLPASGTRRARTHRGGSHRRWALALGCLGLAFAVSCSGGINSSDFGSGPPGPGDPGSGDPGGGGPGGGGGGNPGGGDPGSGSRPLGGGIGPGEPAADVPVPANALYVATDGNDNGPGSRSQPWRTVTRALGALRAGDTLVLRGGTYFERAIPVSLAGTAGAPITVRNEPGEQPIIDGGFTQFRTVGNQDWQVFDAGRDIYRSTATFPGTSQVYGYLGPDDGGFRLVPYETMGALAGDIEDYSEATPFYAGPGVFWNSSDQRIYVRLRHSRYQPQFGVEVPANVDPRQTPLFLFPSRTVLQVASNAQHVLFRGLVLRHGERIADLAGGCHDLTWLACDLTIGRYGLIVRDGVSGLLFDDSRVRGNFPPWVPRSDVKADVKPGHLMQDAAFEFSGHVTNVEIVDSTFTGLFDAIDSSGTPTGFQIHHCEFATIRDDVLEIATAGSAIEFHHNFVHRAAAAVSWNGSTAPALAVAGTKFIHHNVIDVSELQLYGRADPQGLSPSKWLGPQGDGMATGPAFGSHETSSLNGPDPWKIYHNTIVGGADVDNEGLGVCYRFPPSNAAVPHEVYDNIFVQTDDQWIARHARVADGSQVFDGNLYHRTLVRPGTSLIEDLTSATRTSRFASLVDFTTSSAWLDSRTRYPPGWEASGIEADPHLDADYVPAANGPAATGAIDLRATGFPGTVAESHRGAIPPQ